MESWYTAQGLLLTQIYVTAKWEREKKDNVYVFKENSFSLF